MLVYDITKKKSFENISKWLAELRTHGQEDMTLMLIGNKTDLPKMREVRSEDAANFAESEMMALLETSALDSTNVNLAFECIIKGKQIRVNNQASESVCRNLQAKHGSLCS